MGTPKRRDHNRRAVTHTARNWFHRSPNPNNGNNVRNTNTSGAVDNNNANNGNGAAADCGRQRELKVSRGRLAEIKAFTQGTAYLL